MRKNSIRLCCLATLLCCLTAGTTCMLYAENYGTAVPTFEYRGTFDCGSQPKQVLFSPDSRYIVLPLLDGDGFDIFDVQGGAMTKQHVVCPESALKGYAEGLFIPEKNAFLVSQMTTGMVYEYSYPGFQYRRSIDTEGTWSKFIAWSPETGMIAVSNWLSNDVSLINFETGEVVRKLSTGQAPRGLWFLNGGKEIISLSFEGGVIEKFDCTTGKRLDVISIQNAAMRHIVVNRAETKAYISDMYYRSVYVVDLATFKIEKKVKVFNNPNTIDLIKDRWLCVSCRGPNNPEDYTLRSPQNGKIYVFDTVDMSEYFILDGGNQPTGLDVSPDDRYLCFSNFQDDNIELYNIWQRWGD